MALDPVRDFYTVAPQNTILERYRPGTSLPHFIDIGGLHQTVSTQLTSSVAAIGISYAGVNVRYPNHGLVSPNAPLFAQVSHGNDRYSSGMAIDEASQRAYLDALARVGFLPRMAILTDPTVRVIRSASLYHPSAQRVGDNVLARGSSRLDMSQIPNGHVLPGVTVMSALAANQGVINDVVSRYMNAEYDPIHMVLHATPWLRTLLFWTQGTKDIRTFPLPTQNLIQRYANLYEIGKARIADALCQENAANGNIGVHVTRYQLHMNDLALLGFFYLEQFAKATGMEVYMGHPQNPNTPPHILTRVPPSVSWINMMPSQVSSKYAELLKQH